MATFNTNYSKIRLLSNEKILGWINDKEFEIIPPKLLDYYNPILSFLISLLDKDLKEIEDMISGYKIDSHYNLFSTILSGIGGNEDVDKMSAMILTGLQIFIPDIDFKDKMFQIRGEFLNKETFNRLIIMFYEMMGREKIIINDNDDPFTKREKEAKLRVQRIKRKSKKEGAGEKDTTHNMIASILYEFQQYTLEDLFKLNIYTIYYLFGYVVKIANYEVSKIAAGSGTMKKSSKHKYFTE